MLDRNQLVHAVIWPNGKKPALALCDNEGVIQSQFPIGSPRLGSELARMLPDGFYLDTGSCTVLSTAGRLLVKTTAEFDTVVVTERAQHSLEERMQRMERRQMRRLRRQPMRRRRRRRSSRKQNHNQKARSKAMPRDPAMGEPRKRITRMRYDVGPMGFLADQIMKEMQRVGYPATEFNLYRSPERQNKYRARGTSKAGAYSSAHQYFGASDIIHEKWAWFAKKNADGSPTGAPDGEQFWDRLWDCAALVAEKFHVEFRDRISWDPAHIELANWHQMREVVGRSKPNKMQLDWYFHVTLPEVWKQHQRSKARAA